MIKQDEFRCKLDELLKSTSLGEDQKYYVIAHPKFYAEILGWEVNSSQSIGKLQDKGTEKIDYFHTIYQPEYEYTIGVRFLSLDEKLEKMERDPNSPKQMIQINL